MIFATKTTDALRATQTGRDGGYKQTGTEGTNRQGRRVRSKSKTFCDFLCRASARFCGLCGKNLSTLFGAPDGQIDLCHKDHRRASRDTNRQGRRVRSREQGVGSKREERRETRDLRRERTSETRTDERDKRRDAIPHLLLTPCYLLLASCYLLLISSIGCQRKADTPAKDPPQVAERMIAAEIRKRQSACRRPLPICAAA